MYNYNFQTKQFSHILSNIKHVVSNFAGVQPNIDDAYVLQMPWGLAVAFPAKLLGEVHNINLDGRLTENGSPKGYFFIGESRRINFVIHGDVIYLRASM